MAETEMAEAEEAEDKMAEDEVVRGLNDKRTIWQEDQWSMAEMVKDQMLEAEMAKDEMGEDEVDINQIRKMIESHCLLHQLYDCRKKLILTINRPK